MTRACVMRPLLSLLLGALLQTSITAADHDAARLQKEEVSLPTAPIIKKICNVRDYGAKGDNVTEDTDAISKAIADCATAEDGGSVVLPAGVYLSRPIQLVSNIELEIQEDAVIAAWRDRETWPNSTVKKCSASPYQTKDPHLVYRLESVLWAYNASNVAITGGGSVDGQGWRWWPLREKSEYWHNCRPKLVDMVNVDNFRMYNVTVNDSPFWTISARNLTNSEFRYVSVHTTGCGYNEAPNTDGFNLAGENIIIDHCRVRNGDDCVPLFPTTRNVSVTNLYCECGNGIVPIVWPLYSVPGEGGDLRDISFKNVVLNGTNTGVAMKSLPEFVGSIANVIYENITMYGVNEAIMFNVFDQSVDETMKISNVTVKDVTGYNVNQVGKILCDVASPCEGFTFDNVNFHGYQSGYECQHVDKLEATRSSPVPCGAAVAMPVS